MSNINWDEAPEGAMKGFHDSWLRLNLDAVEIYSTNRWIKCANQSTARYMWVKAELHPETVTKNKDKNELAYQKLDTKHATHNKYERELTDRYGSTSNVDVYDVLLAFKVTCPATQHAIKKLLCSGIRGHKNAAQDLLEAKESITRAIELQGETK